MRGYSVIALDNPKTSVNVGSALRAVGCYGARMLVAGNARCDVRSATDTMCMYKHIPVVRVNNVFDALPFDCVPIAIDLVEGAIALPDYYHPERAFYIFGGEDQTLGKRVLDHCRDVVSVPTRYCMNLAACVNVVLYDRNMKRKEW